MRSYFRRGAGSVQVAPGHATTGSSWRDVFREGRMRLGLFLLGLVLFVCFVGPALAPYDPNVFVGSPFAPDVGLLGTDLLGRDVVSRTLGGGQRIIWMAVAATILGMLGGVTIGLTAGYARNHWDTLLMRVMDVFQALPSIVLVLLFVALAGRSLAIIVLLVALAWTPQIARVTRGITLEVVGRDFVRAQEIMGVPTYRILTREVLPNLASPLLVEGALRLTWSVGLIASISFLGFGVQPPVADWGLMINENRQAIAVQPWAVVAPVICIAVLTVGATLVAEATSRHLGGVDRRS